MISIRIVPAVALALVLCIPAVALALGNPSHAIYSPDEESVDSPELAIASDGTQFVAFDTSPDVGDDEVVVLRSTDGGDTWSRWSTVSGPVGVILSDPRLDVVGEGTADERLVLTYVYIEPAVNTRVMAAFADPSLGAGIWTEHEVFDLGGTTTGLEDYDVAFGEGTDTSVACAVALRNGSTQFEWRYNVWLNQTFAFNLETVVTTVWRDTTLASSSAEVALAFHDGAGADRAHLIMTVTGRDFDDVEFTDVYQTGIDDKGLLTTFDPVTLVTTRTYETASMDFMADPDGDTFVYVSDPFEGFVSTNAGASWVPFTLDGGATPELSRLHWLSGDFALSGVTGPTFERQGVEYRPEGAATGTWNERVLLPGLGSVTTPPSVAGDPSRPGETAAVARAATYQVQTSVVNRIWYNATWRDDIGYGVLEGDAPWSTTGNYLGPPTVGDLDGDGDREIVVASGAPRFVGNATYLHVYPHAPSAGSEVVRQVYGLTSLSIPALGDVDDDGDLEIFVGGIAGTVLGFDHELQPLPGWPVDVPSGGDMNVGVAPVTGFARAEVVAAGGSTITVLGRDGTTRPGSWPFVAPTGVVVGRPAVGDVDGDGGVEVVVGLTAGVAVLNSDGTLRGVLSPPGQPSASVSMADVDDDGDLEIFVPLQGGLVHAMHHTGVAIDPVFPFDTTIDEPVSPVVIADVLAPGQPALTFSVDRRVYAIGTDGTALPGYPLLPVGLDEAVGQPVVARVARANVDRPQIVFGDNVGQLHVNTAQAEIPRDWPHLYSDVQVFAPAVSDLDLDGTSEMVVVGAWTVHTLDMGTTPLADPARRWGQVGYDKGKTSCADCVPRNPTSVEPDPGARSSVLVEFRGGWPNPTANVTSLDFTLARRAPVRLQVFDARGRLVRTLVDGERVAGPHAVVWDATDATGAAVASGVYRARLRVGDGAHEVRAVAIVR